MKWFDWMKKKAADEGVTIEDAPSFSEPGRGAAPAPSQADIQAQVNAEVAKAVTAKNAESYHRLNRQEALNPIVVQTNRDKDKEERYA